jgi:hypothetical protein
MYSISKIPCISQNIVAMSFPDESMSFSDEFWLLAFLAVEIPRGPTPWILVLSVDPSDTLTLCHLL